LFIRNVKNDVILKHERDEEVEIVKPCIISAYSPVEDFNKLLEEGIDSGIGITT